MPVQATEISNSSLSRTSISSSISRVSSACTFCSFIFFPCFFAFSFIRRTFRSSTESFHVAEPKGVCAFKERKLRSESGTFLSPCAVYCRRIAFLCLSAAAHWRILLERGEPALIPSQFSSHFLGSIFPGDFSCFGI